MIYERSRRESNYVSVNYLTKSRKSNNISKPNVPAELEADQAAEEVIRNPEADISAKQKDQPVVQAKNAGSKEITADTPNDIHNLGGGNPLDKAERNFFEPRFGADFGDVRVHTDEQAAGMADAINAKAFTKGNDIVFAKGEYQPGTGEGKSLIAHELAHVVQQSQSSSNMINRKEGSKEEEPGILDNIFAAGTKGAAWVIEKTPTVNFIPVPGFEFMANFMKGIMVGSLNRLGQEKVEDLWRITRNVSKAVTSVEYMKAYFWGFLRGFFGDFLMIWELPETIKSTVKFIENLIANIQALSKEDLQGFAVKIEDIKAHIIEGGAEYINDILKDIKAGKASDLIIETLKSLTDFSQDAGKSVGGQLTGLMLEFFSKDHKELGKDLGSIIGELSGTVAFTALLAAITAGVGAVWGGVRAGIKTVTEIIGQGIGKAVKAIGTVFKRIGSVFGKLIDGVRTFIKGFGKSTSKLFKGIKGKLDEVLEKVKGLIDDVLEKLGVSTKAIKETDTLVKYGPMNKGPLPDAIANTFRSGTYSKMVTQEEIILYRAYGGRAGELSSYWTRTKPQGPLQVIIDSALDQNWGNTATKIATIKVPSGTTIYEGFVAQQRGLIGGGNQIFIEKVDPSWLVK